jgi:branched-chain amino acid transport system permease protein
MIDIGVIITGLLSGALYAIVALGLSLVFGVMRLVNLAHGEIMVLGAYVATLVVGAFGMDPLLSLLIVVPVIFLLAYPVQRYLFTGLLRRGMEPPLVAAFGISLLVSASLAQIFGGTARSLNAPYGNAGVELAGVPVRASGLITLAIAVVLIVGTHLVVTRTQWGTALRAAATDPGTASTMGINVNRVYALTFAAAAAFAAVAGVLVGVGYSFAPTTGSSYVLIGFTVVVLGGTGSVLGSLWAGFAVGIVQSIGSTVLGGEYRDLVVYVAFIAILLAGPTVGRLRDWARFRRTTMVAPKLETVK